MQKMKWNYVEIHCNLRQITLQSAWSYDVIWVRKHGKVTEIAMQEDKNEMVEAVQGLHIGIENGFLFLFGGSMKC